MGLSTRNFFGLVDDTQPVGTDSRTISDDQHREILGSLLQQCPNWTGAVTATHADVNTLTGQAAAGVKPMPGQGGVTVLYAYNADTPPLGWTVEEPDANLRNLVIGPAVSGGTIGGSDDPVDQPVNVSLNITGSTSSSSVSHTHSAGSLSLAGSNLNITVSTATQNFSVARGDHTHDVLGNTGGASSTSHSHSNGSLGGSGSDTLRPRYARGILMKLAA